MGSRLLKERLIHPITSVSMLQERYDKVEQSMDTFEDVRKELSCIIDIEKKWRKMLLGTLQPHEFSQMVRCFPYIERIYNTYTLDTECIQAFYDKYSTFFDLKIIQFHWKGAEIKPNFNF